MRAERPHSLKDKTNKEVHPQECPFCVGFEHLPPLEKGRVEREKRQWLVRWLPNKYPALELSDNSETLSENDFFKAYAPYGIQEVIIETSDQRQMVDFSLEHIAIVLKVYNHRIEELSKIEGINYVLVFKNKGREAGASIIHSHSQVIAVNKLPAWIENELEAFAHYPKCPYCEVVKNEQEGPRKVFENDDFLAFTPYAPRFNYEIWIFPKLHLRKLNELKEKQYFSLAEILQKILKKLNEINASYCFYLQYAPQGKDFHWHIEVLPRLNIMAGFELSGGDSIIGVSPEKAAEFYRGNF